MKRKIIQIDEELCNGCGQCILACAEGALKLIDGKARLVSDVYCDGLGDCIGECPTGALTVIEREAEAFDEEAAARNLEERAPEQHEPALACGCPGTAAMTFRPQGARDEPGPAARSMLSHFPVKLQLISPQAPFLKGRDLLLMADCCALCCPDVHRRLLRGRAVAMGCPKLDDLDAHVQQLSEIIRHGGIRSLCVVHMEVPCCSAFVRATVRSAKRAESNIPLSHLMISRQGEVLDEGPLGGDGTHQVQGLSTIS